jgi:hypothetical protein
MAASAVLNGLIFGPMVRCGATLPALFLVVFAVGARCDKTRSTAGLLLCAGATFAEGLSDPQIGAKGQVVLLPVLAGFFAAGRMVRARTETAKALRTRSAELRRQREETARMAVLADRAPVSVDLEGTLYAQIGGIASTAATGLGAIDADHALDADNGAAGQALASIEHDGRAVLAHLRDVLGTLHERAPSEPQPTLARLAELLAGLPPLMLGSSWRGACVPCRLAWSCPATASWSTSCWPWKTRRRQPSLISGHA